MDPEVKPEDTPEEVEYEEADSRSEIISSCYSAITALESVDTGMNKSWAAMKKRTIRRCITLLDYYISEMYYEAFEADEEDD